MKPVTISSLDCIAERKPVCIVNQTRLSIEFVRSIVTNSPCNIASNKGNKTLPLELWLDILDWAETDTNNHEYRLVQPQYVEEHPSQRILVCGKITSWSRCGRLENKRAFTEYLRYLQRPGEGQDPERPFLLPEPGNQETTLKIKASLLGPETGILFNNLSPSDVVSWVEYGACHFCKRSRWIYIPRRVECPRLFGLRLPFSVSTELVACPLCIDLRAPEYEEDVVGYYELAKERFWKLGYIYAF